MTLREHIIELRNRLLISVLAIVVGTVVGWLIYNQAFQLLTRRSSRACGSSTRPGSRPSSSSAASATR